MSEHSARESAHVTTRALPANLGQCVRRWLILASWIPRSSTVLTALTAPAMRSPQGKPNAHTFDGDDAYIASRGCSGEWSQGGRVQISARKVRITGPAPLLGPVKRSKIVGATGATGAHDCSREYHWRWCSRISLASRRSTASRESARNACLSRVRHSRFQASWSWR